jgi:hypothetical protein
VSSFGTPQCIGSTWHSSVQLLLKLVDCVDDRMRGGAAEQVDAGMEPPDQFRWLEYDEEYSYVEDDEHNPNASDDISEQAEADEENLAPAAQDLAWQAEQPLHQDQLIPLPEVAIPGGAQPQDVGQPAVPADPGIQAHHVFDKSAPQPLGLVLTVRMKTHRLMLWLQSFSETSHHDVCSEAAYCKVLH